MRFKHLATAMMAHHIISIIMMPAVLVLFWLSVSTLFSARLPVGWRVGQLATAVPSRARCIYE